MIDQIEDDAKNKNSHEDKKKRKYKRRKPVKECEQTYGLELGSPENVIPTEILIDILSFLPVESVLQCKLVCKTWKSLISSAYFANMHLRRQGYNHNYNSYYSIGYYSIGGAAAATTKGLGLLFTIRFNKYKDVGKYHLYYGEGYDENIDKQYSYTKLRKINHPPINNGRTYAVVSSCNGLICFAQPAQWFYDDYDSSHSYSPHVYITNPITKEYVHLPKLSTTFGGDSQYMAIGFGYLPSSDEYKVVTIYYDTKNKANTKQVHVYTLGDGKGWRRKRDLEYVHTVIGNNNGGSLGGVLANGALHWFGYDCFKLVAFDLADEEFRLVTLPPCLCLFPRGYKFFESDFHLLELGGALCVVHQNSGKCIDIWSLDKKMVNNTTYNTKEPDKYQRSHWSKKFSIPWFLGEEDMGDYYDCFEPFSVTKKGEILFWHKFTILYCYDPKSGTLKKLVDNTSENLKYFRAIPHMNSFVSLKALGEKCRTRRSYNVQRQQGSSAGRAIKVATCKSN